MEPVSHHQLPRIVFAGDRQIAVDVLQYMLNKEVRPVGLILPDRIQASHANELESLCKDLDRKRIWYGKTFRAPETVEVLRSLVPDYIICVHFPLIIPQSILSVPKEGVLNLHPAYLPYGRGWHSAIWAILEKYPYGATLHFMDEGIDTGDIVHQKILVASPGDTGNTLYRRALQLELEVFKEAWPQLVTHSFVRKPQPQDGGTAHKKRDLFSCGIQELDLDAVSRVGDVIDKLRVMTTNRVEEACYFVVNGRRYTVQVSIAADEESNLRSS